MTYFYAAVILAALGILSYFFLEDEHASQAPSEADKRARDNAEHGKKVI